MAFKMKNPGMGKIAKAAGSPHKFGIENKGIDSAARGTKGIDTKSPMKAKDKFKVSTRDKDFLSKKQNELIDKRIEGQKRQDIDRGDGIKVDNYKTKGKRKSTTKIKYDKQGNVKKVVNRTGRFGLRKGSGVSLGEGESKVTGRKAAEKVLATKTDNKVRGKAKREAGDKKL